MLLTKYGVTLLLFILKDGDNNDGDKEHQWKCRFLRVLYLTCKMLYKLIDLATDKGKSLILFMQKHR